MLTSRPSFLRCIIFFWLGQIIHCTLWKLQGPLCERDGVSICSSGTSHISQWKHGNMHVSFIPPDRYTLRPLVCSTDRNVPSYRGSMQVSNFQFIHISRLPRSFIFVPTVLLSHWLVVTPSPLLLFPYFLRRYSPLAFSAGVTYALLNLPL